LGRADYSFPVGKVDMLDLGPLDFEEFCWALGERELIDLIRGCYAENRALGLHDYALSLFRRYLYVGGMPEVVFTHANAGSAAHAEEERHLQQLIIQAYIADMTKYATPLDSSKILNVWRSVPEQLAKENHKFQYRTIESSARAHQYEAAINWLKSAGLVSFCYRVSEGNAPLRAFALQDFFKLYLCDVGLLAALYGAEPQDLDTAENKSSRFRSAMTENYVMQQLVAKGVEPFYWGIASKSEVDFIIRDTNGAVVPLEVKQGKNVSSRSLEAYRKAYSPSYVVRVSGRNFGFENNVRSVPLYAAFCIE
jgi:predicted AAA+ superfamily ATPase